MFYIKKTFHSWFLLLAVCTWILSPSSLRAQTCGCAGAPLLSSQDMASSKAGQLHLGLTYEYHDISDLYTGNTELENRSFSRSTQALLFEVNYGITDRLLATGLFSFTHKTRKSGSRRQNEAVTEGPGDGLFMLKYRLHQNTINEQYQLSVGAGAKIPIGPTDLSGPITAYAPDMQPTTGAVDGVAWAHLSKTFLPTTTLNLFSTVSYRYTGSHDFQNREDYRFGNEFITKIGVSNKFASRFQYTLLGKYRHVSEFEFQGTGLPNTGGSWINVIPGMNYQINPDLTVRLSAELPIYRYLDGTQATTRYAGQASVFYSF